MLWLFQQVTWGSQLRKLMTWKFGFPLKRHTVKSVQAPNCEDFQARRAMIRYRDENDKVQYAHTRMVLV